MTSKTKQPKGAPARLVEALKSLRAILARLDPPVPVKPKGLPGYQVGYDEPKVRQALGEIFTAGGDWWIEHEHYHNVFLDIQDALRVLKELPVPPSILRRLDAFIADCGGRKQSLQAPVLNRTTGILTLPNGRAAKLDGGEKYLLVRLVELGSASGSELKDAHARPDKALRALIRKYHLAKYISLPGGPGKGGYSTTIVDESP